MKDNKICQQASAITQRLCTQNRIEEWIKGCNPQFLIKGNFRITDEYSSIILTALAVKVFLNHFVLLNRYLTMA